MIGHCTHYGRPRWACPVCLAEDVRLLLKTGRPAMAEQLLNELPDLIHDAIGLAFARGHDGTVLAQRAREEPDHDPYQHEGWR
jgi:hypothetical protein